MKRARKVGIAADCLDDRESPALLDVRTERVAPQRVLGHQPIEMSASSSACWPSYGPSCSPTMSGGAAKGSIEAGLYMPAALQGADHGLMFAGRESPR